MRSLAAARVLASAVTATIAAATALAFPAEAGSAWTADTARSIVTLSCSQMLAAKIRGTIPIASATVSMADADLTPAKVDVTLHSADMTTGDSGRDAELRGGHFFDVARYPTIVFTSERIEPRGPQHFVVDGALAMRGTSQTVAFDTRVVWVRRDPDGRRRVRYEGVAHFRRSDYGMTYARPIVGNDVQLNLAMEVTN